jgi:hypothetical protein
MQDKGTQPYIRYMEGMRVKVEGGAVEVSAPAVVYMPYRTKRFDDPVPVSSSFMYALSPIDWCAPLDHV